jgi:peroxiredoxin
MNQTIAEQVFALKEGMATATPADVFAAFDEEQAGLDAAGIPPDIAVAGTRMPDGDLIDGAGVVTNLAAIRDGAAAVLVFYRGAWCPYCNLALRAYQDQLAPALTEQGVKLIAISPQRPEGSMKMQERNKLSFTVVSDPANKIAAQLGILTAPTETAVAAQAKLRLNLTNVNADGTSALPMPTVVVVDAEGIIRWIDVHPNYTTRSEPSEILAVVAAATSCQVH